MSLKRLKPIEGCSAAPETHAKCTHLEGDDGESEDSDDDEGEVVLEEDTEQVRIDDRDRLDRFYRDSFTQNGQSHLKKVMKAWIKTRQPRKQSENPYNGGKSRRVRDHDRERFGISDDNPGRWTAPSYWCTQIDWEIGKGCRHREPDHLKKPGLCSHIHRQ